MEQILNQIMLYLIKVNGLLPQQWWYIILGLLVILLGLRISIRKRHTRKGRFNTVASAESEATVESSQKAVPLEETPSEPIPESPLSSDGAAGVRELSPAGDSAPQEEPSLEQQPEPPAEPIEEAAQASFPSPADATPPAPLAQIAPQVTEELAEPVKSIESEATAEEKPISLFGRLKNGLSKTRQVLTTNIEGLFTGNGQLDDDLLEKLEELLITSDVGVQTTLDIVEKISANGSNISDAAALKVALKNEIEALMSNQMTEASPQQKMTTPHVIMVVGVNGVGKTTTIGKLAAHYHDDGHSVLIAAADTFRAAAVEQVSIWAERADAEIVKHREGADPAAVAFDGVEAAIARKKDIVLIDTAGRLHTRVNLMEELKKIKRAIAKKLPGAPHEILLVLDATTGQNALSQAELFHEALDVTGIALTKLDGTAKGGIVVSICSTLQIPLKHIGVGESIEDLQRFEPVAFTDALF